MVEVGLDWGIIRIEQGRTFQTENDREKGEHLRSIVKQRQAGGWGVCSSRR